MAEPQAQPATPSPDIGGLIGGDQGAVTDLIGVQRVKTAADADIIAGSERVQSADAKRVQKAYEAEGIGHDELKPWDADKEHKKFEHDPIEGFGSTGALFAMVASAFTRAPMENAMLGMAGALNSIKEGDEKAYERAHQSWKDNTKLVLDRHKAQHELYADALSLMSTNQQIASIKLNNAVVKFGDQKMLVLAEHGMIKEMFELQEARARSAATMQQTMDLTTEKSLRDKAYEAGLKDLEPTNNPAVDAAHKLALYTRTHGLQKETPQQALMGQFFLENPKATAEEAAQFADKHGIIRQYGSSGGKSTESGLIAGEIKRRAEQKMSEGMEASDAFDAAMKEVKAASIKPLAERPMTESALVAKEIQKRADDKITGGMDAHAAFDEATREVKAAGRKPEGQLSRPKAEQQEIDRRTKLYEQENIDKGMDADKSHVAASDRAVREVASAKAVPSGNRIDDLRGKRDQVDNILTASEQNLDFLHQFKGGAGLMGKIMRGEEIASNIVGAGTQSDRVAFRRRVHELQEMVPRIITDQNGRPLKAAQDKVDDFVAGLNAGDTGPNTIRAYEDLIEIMKKRKADYSGRLEGGYDPAAKSSGAKSGEPEKKSDVESAPWLRDPVKP